LENNFKTHLVNDLKIMHLMIVNASLAKLFRHFCNLSTEQQQQQQQPQQPQQQQHATAKAE